MSKRKIQTKIKKTLQKVKKNKTKFTLMEVLIIILISVAIGSVLGASIVYKKEKVVVSKVPPELESFVETCDSIINNYYKKINKKELIEKAIEGMVNSLDDPYTNYMDKRMTKEFNQIVAGKYKGIGITVQVNDDNLEVIDIFKNSPASKKLKKKDKIIEVNGKKVTSKNANKLLEIIKKKAKNEITLKILRNGKEKNIKIKTDTVNLPSVTSKIIEREDKRIGYIYINIFASNTYAQFKQKLENLEAKKIDSLIIDVRENSGGYLDQVTKILELFMDKKKILYQIQSKKSIAKVHSSTDTKREYQIVVIMDHGSASASEILASAIKESYKGSVVGVNSYGKGTVQNAYSLNDGTSLKYTTQKWLTPKGNWINGKGVEPNIKVKLSEEYLEDPTDENDNQLQEAINLLLK